MAIVQRVRPLMDLGERQESATVKEIMVHCDSLVVNKGRDGMWTHGMMGVTHFVPGMVLPTMFKGLKNPVRWCTTWAKKWLESQSAATQKRVSTIYHAEEHAAGFMHTTEAIKEGTLLLRNDVLDELAPLWRCHEKVSLLGQVYASALKRLLLGRGSNDEVCVLEAVRDINAASSSIGEGHKYAMVDAIFGARARVGPNSEIVWDTCDYSQKQLAGVGRTLHIEPAPPPKQLGSKKRASAVRKTPSSKQIAGPQAKKQKPKRPVPKQTERKQSSDESSESASERTESESEAEAVASEAEAVNDEDVAAFEGRITVKEMQCALRFCRLKVTGNKKVIAARLKTGFGRLKFQKNHAIKRNLVEGERTYVLEYTLHEKEAISAWVTSEGSNTPFLLAFDGTWEWKDSVDVH